jgi:hypothetical protein
MLKRNTRAGLIVSLCFCGLCQAQAPATVADCVEVLKIQDYYSFAQKNNLMLDYIRSIDYETFEQMKRNANAGGSALLPVGLFSANMSYDDFNQKRTKFLENEHYNRTESQAINILQITTSPRAYTAYTDCLAHINQPGLIAWAAKEDSNTIELHVKYQNPTGVPSMRINGTLTGGSVAGAPQNHLWKDGTRWGIMQEKVFTITRSPGSSETTVIIAPQDGSTPFTKTYYRADATLTLDYVGTTDVLRTPNRSAAPRAHTPNNNHNDKHCTNEVGRDSGKWCISRTTISISTAAPHFFKNARLDCQGTGCPWARFESGSPSVSADGLTASGAILNWGWDVTMGLTVDEWEHLSKAQCSGDGPIPVVFGQTVVFSSATECDPIGMIKLKLNKDNSESAIRFGKPTAPLSKITLQSVLSTGTSTITTYRVNAPAPGP